VEETTACICYQVYESPIQRSAKTGCDPVTSLKNGSKSNTVKSDNAVAIVSRPAGCADREAD
jgi:hypothetical protein